ncbi:MAG TPA: glycerol-3-phosphate 1-O-acyltransferase PlsY [Bacteroidales bacterium]|nr:glycerol-3-phosphate 1-O-acyltransferase PlsY [Bacteroidales bacterium]
MNLTTQIIYLAFTYLLGAIPFAYILTLRATGKNIMEHGSGNVGSTNVKRVAGKKIAMYTQLLDMLKGLLPVAILLVSSSQDWITYPPFYIYLVALAAILGHDFSIFLLFKGGKGVNTTLGASILLSPVPVLIAVAIYFIVKKVFKFVSMGSIALSITMPLAEYFLHGLTNAFYYLIVAALLIIARHYKNIRRLLSGKENL